jgi:hypothetical protein
VGVVYKHHSIIYFYFFANREEGGEWSVNANLTISW